MSGARRNPGVVVPALTALGEAEKSKSRRMFSFTTQLRITDIS